MIDSEIYCNLLEIGQNDSSPHFHLSIEWMNRNFNFSLNFISLKTKYNTNIVNGIADENKKKCLPRPHSTRHFFYSLSPIFTFDVI